MPANNSHVSETASTASTATTSTTSVPPQDPNLDSGSSPPCTEAYFRLKAEELARQEWSAKQIARRFFNENRECPQQLGEAKLNRFAQEAVAAANVTSTQPAASPAASTLSSLTDHQLSIDFCKRYFASMRFVPDWDEWITWNEVKWERGPVWMLLRKDFLEPIAQQLASNPATKNIGEQLLSASTIQAIERLARQVTSSWIYSNQLDQNPFLLTTPISVVDLTSGHVRKPRREDFCTKSVSVEPRRMDIPLWNKFMEELTQGDAEMAAYLKRLAGYALTGSSREQILFFLYGPGGNGKGVFVRTVQRILGREFAREIAIKALLSHTTAGQATPELAALQGARFAVANEPGSDQTWNESVIKYLTGNDLITARNLYKPLVTFPPSHTLVVVSNDVPKIKKVDRGWWRRLNFVGLYAQPEMDEKLEEKLTAELPGILMWAIEGALKWQQKGIVPPSAVIRDTENYLRDEDDVTAWMDECLDQDDANGFTTSAELFESWSTWCRRNHVESVGSPNNLTRQIREKSQHKDPRTKNPKTGMRGCFGVTLRKNVFGDPY